VFNLKKTLLKAHSKENCDLIVRYVGKNQNRFDELFTIFISDDKRLVQMSSWPLSYCVEAYPFFIEKHFENLFENLKKQSNHDAVKRHTLRLLQFVTIPTKFHGEVMNSCFSFIQKIEEKPAVKVFSLVLLENLVKIYPEIKSELLLIIETNLPFETAGFISRARKILGEKKIA
jgi:hypothetical protein